MTTDPRAQAIEQAASRLITQIRAEGGHGYEVHNLAEHLNAALALPPDPTTSELREADRLAVNIGILLRRRPGLELLIYDNDGENFGVRLLDTNADGTAKCIARRISFDLPFVIDAFNQQLSAAAAVKGAQQ